MVYLILLFLAGVAEVSSQRGFQPAVLPVWYLLRAPKCVTHASILACVTRHKFWCVHITHTNTQPVLLLRPEPQGSAGRPIINRSMYYLLITPADSHYSYKTVSVHGIFKWPSSFLYNLRIDCWSQDYRWMVQDLCSNRIILKSVCPFYPAGQINRSKRRPTERGMKRRNET